MKQFAFIFLLLIVHYLTAMNTAQHCGTTGLLIDPHIKQKIIHFGLERGLLVLEEYKKKHASETMLEVLFNRHREIENLLEVISDAKKIINEKKDMSAAERTLFQNSYSKQQEDAEKELFSLQIAALHHAVEIWMQHNYVKECLSTKQPPVTQSADA